jgi:hypothetical protein
MDLCFDSVKFFEGYLPAQPGFNYSREYDNNQSQGITAVSNLHGLIIYIFGRYIVVFEREAHRSLFQFNPVGSAPSLKDLKPKYFAVSKIINSLILSG